MESVARCCPCILEVYIVGGIQSLFLQQQFPAKDGLYAGVAQLAERELPKLEVMGSTPTARCLKFISYFVLFNNLRKIRAQLTLFIICDKIVVFRCNLVPGASIWYRKSLRSSLAFFFAKI